MSENSGDVRKDWTVTIVIDEHDGRTRAKATLVWRDKTATGFGLARRNPADRNVTDIGDELAVARALADLAGQLKSVTVHDIEAVTQQSVTALR